MLKDKHKDQKFQSILNDLVPNPEDVFWQQKNFLSDNVLSVLEIGYAFNFQSDQGNQRPTRSRRWTTTVPLPQHGSLYNLILPDLIARERLDNCHKVQKSLHRINSANDQGKPDDDNPQI